MERHHLWRTCGVALPLWVLWTTGVMGVPHGNEQGLSASQADAPQVDEPSCTGGEAKLSDDEIRDLDQIRRQIGEGLVEHALWNDQLSGDGAETEFTRELRQQYGSSGHPQPLEAGAGTRVHSTSTLLTGSEVQAIVFRQRSIRSLGRRLDAIAQDMDDLRLFDRADELREMSRRLRDEIRSAAESRPEATVDE